MYRTGQASLRQIPLLHQNTNVQNRPSFSATNSTTASRYKCTEQIKLLCDKFRYCIKIQMYRTDQASLRQIPLLHQDTNVQNRPSFSATNSTTTSRYKCTEQTKLLCDKFHYYIKIQMYRTDQASLRQIPLLHQNTNVQNRPSFSATNSTTASKYKRTET